MESSLLNARSIDSAHRLQCRLHIYYIGIGTQAKKKQYTNTSYHARQHIFMNKLLFAVTNTNMNKLYPYSEVDDVFN